MKAIVTGGAGFIGSHLADRLIALGAKVVVVDNLSAGFGENVPSGARFYRTDFDDVDYFKESLVDCDVIFHNAASKKNVCLHDPNKDLDVNGAATLRLLRACKEICKKKIKFVHASTGSVYGEAEGLLTEKTPTKPVSFYGISKLAGENYVTLFNRLYDLDTTVLRYFHVYGDRQRNDQQQGGVISIFSKKILNREPITIHGDGNQQRLFTWVNDVVDANLLAFYNVKMKGEIFNVASETKVTVNEAALYMMEKIGTVVPVQYEDPLIGDIYAFNINTWKINQFMRFVPFYEGILRTSLLAKKK